MRGYLDGVKWIYEEAWILFRPSGTEPLLRIYAEATGEKTLRTLLREAEAMVRSLAS